jgi:hypothetical protein
MRKKKYEGITTGMKVMHYQDYTFSINDRPDRRLTDRELVTDWHAEHPEALHLDKQDKKGVFTYVRDSRKNYNQGKQHHGARNANGEIVGPGRPMSKPYDENGKQYIYNEDWWESCHNS